MRVINGLDNVGPDLAGCVLSIGNFDGVHLGHQRILCRASEAASGRSRPSVAITFDVHPLAVVAPDRTPPMLTPLDEKLHEMAKCGPDVAIVARADRELLGRTAEDFVEHIIVRRFRASSVIEGPSFRYGRGRQGDVDTLRDSGTKFGFDVEIVDPMHVEIARGRREMISSSLIRGAIADGNVALAARALGRPYALMGPIIQGRGLGRRLGFPTANVAVTNQLLPAEGVYAGHATVRDARHVAAISIGRTPTFHGTSVLLEAYLLEFDCEVHGESMRLEVEAWLRPQLTFASSEELTRQIEQDVAAVRGAANSFNHREHREHRDE
jgi:riboflavin kinase/FMN adenylyltransferase